jgi:DNA-binding NtrC family response regulator
VKQIDGITPEALEILSAFSWPGNIRQLKNVIARSVILSRETLLGVDDLPQDIVGDVTSAEPPGRVCLISSLPPEGMGKRIA